MGFREGAAEDGEVLREHVHETAVDAPETGDHAIAEDLLLIRDVLAAAGGNERVELDEAPLVHQEIDALARGQLALRVLLGDPLLAATAGRSSA